MQTAAAHVAAPSLRSACLWSVLAVPLELAFAPTAAFLSAFGSSAARDGASDDAAGLSAPWRWCRAADQLADAVLVIHLALQASASLRFSLASRVRAPPLDGESPADARRRTRAAPRGRAAVLPRDDPGAAAR